MQMSIPLEIIPVKPMTDAEFMLAHDADFVKNIFGGSISNGFDNRDLAVARSLRYTNASLRDAALHALRQGGVAVSPSSGFHHACYDRANEFCTFNGLMIAACSLFKQGLANKVGIIDCDYHYGDGTDDIIQRLNLWDKVKHFRAGMEYTTVDQANEFLSRLHGVVESMRDCDVILYQAGADADINDPLGGFLTQEKMYQRDLRVFEACRRFGVPVVWNLAGGYQRLANGDVNWKAITDIHSNTLHACWSVFDGSGV